MKRLGEFALTGLLCLALVPPLLAQQEGPPPAIPPILEGNRPLAHPESKHPEGPTAETEKPSPATPTVKPGRKPRPASQVSSKKKGKKTVASGKKKSPKASRKKGVATTRGASARNT
ncbi:MAG: hypothetical protein K6T55_00785 [Syntrophobacterales bacterium]|nr:hypothetical protein [Syntrophobacterales bacterium]